MDNDRFPRAFGPFTLLKRLGEGASGGVFLGRSSVPSLPELVVIKRLLDRVSKNRVQRLRLEHEARIAVAIDSPRVVKVHAMGAIDEVPFIAMEHVEGWALGAMLRAFLSAPAKVPIPLAAALIADLLEGLEALQTTVDPVSSEPLEAVHRDLSPRNVMVRDSIEGVLIDLGLGKSSVKEWATRAGRVMGTPGYMAPEVVRGAQADHRSDLYAAAVLLFEMLTLEPYVPRMADPMQRVANSARPEFRAVSAIRSDAPSTLDDVLRRALALEPEDRFSKASELRAAVLDACGSQSLETARDERLLPGLLLLDREVRRAENLELLGRSLELEPDRAETRVFARRSARSQPDISTATDPTVSAPETITDKAPGTEVINTAPMVLQKPAALKPRARTPLIVLGGVAAVLLALLIDRITSDRDVLPVSTEPEASPPEVRAVAAPKTVEPPVITSPPEVVIEPEVVPLSRRPIRPRTPQPKTLSVDETPEAPVEKIDLERAKQNLEQLISRAEKLRAEKPSLSSQIDALLIDAALWQRSRDPERVVEATAALQTKLDRLR